MIIYNPLKHCKQHSLCIVVFDINYSMIYVVSYFGMRQNMED